MKKNILLGNSVGLKIKCKISDTIFFNINIKTNTLVNEIISDIIVREIYSKTLITI